jgi:hypothetical protein
MPSCARRRTRLSIVVPLLASLLLLPYSAAAADSTMGQDEVTLKNGGTIRGTVVSSEPGVSVRIIELGSTEARTVPWAQVGDIERGKFAPKGPSVQPGSAGPGYGPAAPAYVPPIPVPVPAQGAPQNQVRLHVNSPQPATAVSHRVAYGRIGWGGFAIDTATPVCMSPCDQVFDSGTGQMYSVERDFNRRPPSRSALGAGMWSSRWIRGAAGSIARGSL